MKSILTKQQIENMAGVAKTHFLNDRARRINKSLGDATGLTNLGFHIIEVAPGDESTEYHLHHYEDECIYILSGNATVTKGADLYEVGEGDFIGCPAGGEAHSMKNTGMEILRCIVVGQRLQNEIVDYPNLKKRLYMHDGDNDLVDYADIQAAEAGKKTE